MWNKKYLRVCLSVFGVCVCVQGTSCACVCVYNFDLLDTPLATPALSCEAMGRGRGGGASFRVCFTFAGENFQHIFLDSAARLAVCVCSF